MEADLDYLIVDEFLSTLVGARALKSALDLGLVDQLADGGADRADLRERLGCDKPGLDLMLDLLAADGVIEVASDGVRLTSRFERALAYRDLMETKLDFIGFVLLDFIDRFEAMIVDPARFQREAQLFRLFDYRRAAEPSDESYAWTKVWMRLTTALTRYEAGACMRHHDFSGVRRMLDVGGNSGEFVLRICKEHPELRASVMDLPVVCEFGQDHILPEPERERISFIPGSAFEDPIPEGFDLISFKSMLHDWPEEQAGRLLERAAEALEPGGTLLIFERGPLVFDDGPPPVSLLPILMFARSYREPDFYIEKLEQLGFDGIELQEMRLESDFFLITATR